MHKDFYNYDVIVVGGGHAGAEAAAASARLGASTLLITMNIDHIGQMSCNPAIGGIAKGHVVREIDAMGGLMGRVTEAATIQFRMLNQGKGPAVWSPRAQCDKYIYLHALKFELEKTKNLNIHQAEVESFILDNGKIEGIITQFGDRFYCKSIVICSGTFLGGKLHYGMNNFQGGRAGDFSSFKLSDALKNQLDLTMGRLKTGTPQRIVGKTIDFEKMEKQSTEAFEENFTFFDEESYPKTDRKDLNCYLVKTSEATAEVVRKNLHRAPMYSGKIEGIGARYCPSFEDKIVRFPHHETHTLYLEPEGVHCDEYYINGFSTSLPTEVQWEMLRTIPGLEKAQISRYAYAIEYDFVFPEQINRSLSVKKYPNLFLAGQINGTSGYEEAGAQGLIAGLNAARLANGQTFIEIGRDLAYIGVMIDDIVSKNIMEPYRLFTSRAEYRLHLRQDCADLRLCEFAYEIGLLPSDKYNSYLNYKNKLDKAFDLSKINKIDGKTIKDHLRDLHGNVAEPLPFNAEQLDLNLNNKIDRRVLRQLGIFAHYEGYLVREDSEINKLHLLEQVKIPTSFDYQKIKGLSNEARAKLLKIKPTTIAQAARIDGVTPAELTILRVHLKRAE